MTDYLAQCRYVRAQFEISIRDLNPGALIREGVREIDDEVLAPLRAKAFPTAVEITSDKAVPFLRECIKDTELHIAKHAVSYTVGRWMWYLRHLPRAVFDIVGHEEGVRARHLAESIAALYGASDENSRTPFRINQSTMRQIIRFAGMVFHLDSIHGHYQWTGTDAPFRFGTRPLPDANPPADVKTAVSTYLQRLDAEEFAFAGLGSFVVPAVTTKGEIGILVAIERPSPVDVNVRNYLLKPRSEVVHSYFEASRISVRSVIDLLSHDSVGDAPLLPGFYASLCVLALTLIAFQSSEGCAEHTLEHGYTSFDRQSAELLCREGLPRLNAECERLPPDVRRATTLDELKAVVAEARAEVHRLRPGPLLIAARDRVLFDVASATQRLFVDAEYPAKVSPGKERYRSEAFELATQREVDAGPWRPSARIRELRGRVLRVDGKDLTDVDALAEREQVLLLVSCKSIPYSGEVDIGRRRVMRNIASKLADYEAEWRAKVNRIRLQRKGDNFDFSVYTRIEGVLITPHVFYVIGDQFLDEALPGLKVYSSLTELRDWLRSN
jgi:hypothetical protein